MIVEKIEILCKKRGINISKLEKECGIGNGTIARWNKSYPRTDTLKKVADYFGVSIEYFINDEPEQKDKKPTFNDIRKEHGLSPVEGGDVVLTKE